MATSSPPNGRNPNSNPNPPWFSPLRLLMIFCAINMLNYIDRGAIASNGVNGSPETCTESGICATGSGIQGDFKLNYFEDGVLSSAFMVGLLVSSAIFASLAKSRNPFRLIGVGLFVWTFATAGCGFSFDFWSIAICRMLVGVGEASFMSLAAPFIDDNAPQAQKTAWLAAFYMCIPTGIAVGYIYGGLVGGYLNWRWAFWLESLLMLPFATFGFIVSPLQLKGFTEHESKKTYEESGRTEFQDVQVLNDVEEGGRQMQKNISLCDTLSKIMWNIIEHMMKFWEDFRTLLLNKVYVTSVSGYVAYNFVIGAYSYWGPKAGYAIYKMENADILFGAITVVCGIFGTFSGGYVLDRIESTLPNAFKLLSASAFVGAIFCLGAFCMRNLAAFIMLFSVGELLVFAVQAPVNFMALHCVTSDLRPLSMAMSTVLIHVFGDVPSSPLVGVLQDYVNNWRVTALILTSILFVAVAIWFGGIFLPSVDRFEDHQMGTPKSETHDKRPLLDEKADESSSQ